VQCSADEMGVWRLHSGERGGVEREDRRGDETMEMRESRHGNNWREGCCERVLGEAGQDGGTATRLLTRD
jgi:hypothetical protein